MPPVSLFIFYTALEIQTLMNRSLHEAFVMNFDQNIRNTFRTLTPCTKYFGTSTPLPYISHFQTSNPLNVSKPQKSNKWPSPMFVKYSEHHWHTSIVKFTCTFTINYPKEGTNDLKCSAVKCKQAWKQNPGVLLSHRRWKHTLELILPCSVREQYYLFVSSNIADSKVYRDKLTAE